MGDTLSLVGGETAVGFFLDGEEAQQPVIIGLLNRSQEVADSISEEEIFSSGSNHFGVMTGYTGKVVPATKRGFVAVENPTITKEKEVKSGEVKIKKLQIHQT